MMERDPTARDPMDGVGGPVERMHRALGAVVSLVFVGIVDVDGAAFGDSGLVSTMKRTPSKRKKAGLNSS